jgi:type IV pilus assembly protein PilW
MIHILSTQPLAASRRAAGMTLIELMVALAIGAFMMIGAVTVFMQSRTTFRVTESMARLQENGRFVLEALESDIRMAGFWGLSSRSYEIRFRATATQPNGIGTDVCGQNWTIDLNSAVAGTNNGWTWPCLAALNPRATSDTLVVRRVAEDSLTPANVAAAHGDTMYVLSFRGGPALGEIFLGSAGVPGTYVAPVPPEVYSEIHRLVVNGYYVSNASTAPNAGPSLRRQMLDPATASDMRDEEVLSGVEDFQVEFGVDTDAPGAGESGLIDRYVNPGDAVLNNPNTAVLAVRIWLRLRAETEERGFVDTATYTYADQNVGPFNDGFRRIVVTKTIYLRNSRPVGS